MSKPPSGDWREPHKQLDLVDWLHAKANALPWPGRQVRRRKRRKGECWRDVASESVPRFALVGQKLTRRRVVGG
jgi:hypothetical protein